ncbi:MAG: energy-coupling factor transporter transmembrane protein EcfT [Synergistaceae bacterium]|nr:energy-coupling factor transporter transmembrane protein EcfT [Synergistaceae bacterium]
MKFLNHLTLGQYVPADSPVHRLDPRCKILSVVVLLAGIFLMVHPVAFLAWGGLLLVLARFSRVPFRVVLQGARPVVMLVIFTAGIHLFLTKGVVLWEWGPVSVTREGVTMALRMGLRLFFLVLFAGFLTLTTSPMELSDGLESLFRPFQRFGFPAHEMAMMMTISLRFIPTLFDETDRILRAQLARGADLEHGGLFRRLKAFIPVLVPLFVIVFQRAEDLALAMEARCYQGGSGRTRMNPLEWKKSDTFAIAGVIGIVAFFVLLDLKG